MEQAKRVSEMKQPSTLLRGEEWGRSMPARAPHAKQALQLKRSWVSGEKREAGIATVSSAASGNGEHYWRFSAGAFGDWHDQTVRAHTSTERVYDASSRTVQVADFSSGKFSGCIVGKYDGQGSIVFDRSPRQNIAAPQDPPGWLR